MRSAIIIILGLIPGVPDLGFDGPRRVICIESAERKYEACIDRISNTPSPEYEIESALCLAGLDIRISLCTIPECRNTYPCDDHIDICSIL